MSSFLTGLYFKPAYDQAAGVQVVVSEKKNIFSAYILIRFVFLANV
jgi:hypothetical protein